MRTHAKKLTFFLICLILLLGISGCGLPELPDDSSIKYKLEDYYSQIDCQIQSIEITQETINKDIREAWRDCKITSVAIDGSFQSVDTWQARYTLPEKSQEWILQSTTYCSSDYELLKDLSTDDCRMLLNEVVPQDTSIDSIHTDRENFTAEVSSHYQVEEQEYGDYGGIRTDGTVTAKFEWDAENRWTLKDLDRSETQTYNLAFTLRVEPSKDIFLYTLESEKFWLEMDVKIEDNIPSIENIKYHGGICLVGNLSIDHVELKKEEGNPKVIYVTFDYVRDNNNIQNDPNYRETYAKQYQTTTGSGYIRICKDGTLSGDTVLFLENWEYIDGNSWKDYSCHASRK